VADLDVVAVGGAHPLGDHHAIARGVDGCAHRGFVIDTSVDLNCAYFGPACGSFGRSGSFSFKVFTVWQAGNNITHRMATVRFIAIRDGVVLIVRITLIMLKTFLECVFDVMCWCGAAVCCRGEQPIWTRQTV